MPFGLSPVSSLLMHYLSHFFALFLLILHGIRNTIDCKRETKWNIKKEGDDGAPGGYGTVYIFVLCGKRDRRILQGKEKMTFSDFDRLNYIQIFWD